MVIRFANVSLKNKIFFTILVFLLVLSAAIALLARGILVSSLTRELTHRGIAIAQSIAERGSGFILDDDTPSLVSLIFDSAQLGERKTLVAYIFITDQNHNVLANTFIHPFPDTLRTSNDVPDGEPHSVKALKVFDEPAYDIAVPVKEGIYKIATVHVGLNKRHIDSLVGKLRITFLGYISAVIVLIFMLSHRISAYITQPISKLITMSDEISKGNLKFELDLGKQYNELLKGSGDWERCPAYHNSDLPCWHVDKTMGSVSPDQPPPVKPPYCRECVVRHRQMGDEVLQLADSFVYMVRSVKLFRNRLRESEAKYRSLFNSGPDPIFVLDRETLEVLDANPRAEAVYDYSKYELLGMSFRDLESEDSVAALSRNVDHFARPGSSMFFPKVIHYRRNNKPFFVNMHACSTVIEDTEAIIVSTTDITDMIEKDAQIIQASKMSTLGEMSAGIAHEMNQPLTAIKMGGDFLRRMAASDKMPTKDQLAQVTSEISAQVMRAKDIINTLRQFGRKADLTVVRTDINEPVHAVMKIVNQQLKLQNITIDLELQDQLPPVKAHSNRLQQVLFNLVSNARDAINLRGEDDARRRTIAIRSHLEDGHVVMTVTDTGTGIEESRLDKIFEPFFTTKETGQGMGLGLAICYGIVKDYGGEISVDSIVGKGTTFRLTFPAAA